MSTRSGPGSLIERAEWIKHSLTVEASDILTELVDEVEQLREALEFYATHPLGDTGYKASEALWAVRG